MNVSVIIPVRNPERKIMGIIERRIKEQDFPGKIGLIKVEKGMGLADSMNYGIKKAKTDIVVTLHQDCVPSSKDWLRRLVEPFKDKNIIASVSKVELPYDFWKGFDILGRMMSAKEQGILTPLLDEKGCAYRKDVLIRAGLFDGKTFKTAGEDFDMWMKIRKFGKIAYPDCKIFHYHKHSFFRRLKKEYQLSNGFGALVRIYGKEMPRWHVGLAKSIPLLGWPLFLISFPYKKMGISSMLWIPLSFFINLIYSAGFWKGFLMKRQTV